MWSMKDMFYGTAEPVWILNHDKDEVEVEEENGSRDTNHEPQWKEEGNGSSYTHPIQTQQDSAQANSPYYPYYPYNPTYSSYPYYPYNPTYSSYPYHPDPYYFAGLNSRDAPEREMEVVMKVPICCSECEDSIKLPLSEMNGVKSVTCSIRNKKVTVVTTTAAPADILMECRKVFRESRMWTEDD